jgi:hypothetical protein
LLRQSAGIPEDVDSILSDDIPDIPPQAGRMSVDPDGFDPDGPVTTHPHRRTQALPRPGRHNPKVSSIPKGKGIPKSWRADDERAWKQYRNRQEEMHADFQAEDDVEEEEVEEDEEDEYEEYEDDEGVSLTSSQRDAKERAELAELMATSIATGLKDALSPILSKKTKQKPSDVITPAGLGVKTDGARSLDDVLNGKVKISRYERGEGASKEKLITRLCEPLKKKFQAVDALKLLDPDSDVDVASMTLDIDTVIKGFTDWVISNDGHALFRFPTGFKIQMISVVSSMHRLTPIFSKSTASFPS